MTVNKGIITSSVITSTSQHKRDVSETIRRLYPRINPFLWLVSGSDTDAWGNPAPKTGNIKKTKAVRLDPEWFRYVPPELFTTATGGSSNTAIVADNSGWQVNDKIINATQSKVGFVNSINIDTVTLGVTAVDGTTWACSDKDQIVQSNSVYEEGTSRYNVVSKELDRSYTYLEILRQGISIADTVKKTPQYTNEGMLERYTKDNTISVLWKTENSFWLSQQGKTNVVIDGVTYPINTMKGVCSYATGAAIDLAGGFNYAEFQGLYPQLPRTLGADSVLYMATSRNIVNIMQQMAMKQYLLTNDKVDTFGVLPKRYLMGSVEVQPIALEQFDRGAYSNSAVFFNSEDLEYRFMDGMDLNIRENAQLPSTMGTTNIFEGVVGLQSWSDGANIVTVKNLLPTA